MRNEYVSAGIAADRAALSRLRQLAKTLDYAKQRHRGPLRKAIEASALSGTPAAGTGRSTRRDLWLDAVATEDWIMKLPYDLDYINPFTMQGCAFSE